MLTDSQDICGTVRQLSSFRTPMFAKLVRPRSLSLSPPQLRVQRVLFRQAAQQPVVGVFNTPTFGVEHTNHDNSGKLPFDVFFASSLTRASFAASPSPGGALPASAGRAAA